jgi:hypothetical protein
MMTSEGESSSESSAVQTDSVRDEVEALQLPPQ